jgi:amino acid adenylation domain-containing protein
VVVFNGDYHGQFDEVLVKGAKRSGGGAPRSLPVATGIPHSAVENMIVLDYATPATLQWLRENAEELAAVIVEPVQSRHPDLQPFDFLREVRQITEASGTAFVIDEVVTGFRVHPGGIQALTGIRADMATYGKVVGGGLPIGILAGKEKFMDALDGGQWNFGDDSFPEVGVTFFAGTFVRHPLVLAATWAVLNHLKAHGAELQEQLSRRAAGLVKQINELFQQHGLVTKVEHFSSFFYFNFYNEHHPLVGLFYYHLRERGIHIQDGFPCFLTTQHSDADLQRILDAFRSSLEELQAVGILGHQPKAVAAESMQTETITGVPLTESQVEIWLAAQLGDEASCAFNESVTLKLKGQLNEAHLRTSIDRVIARHDALRASFSATGEEMRIAPQMTLALNAADFSSMPAAGAEAAFAELLAQDARTPFDLVEGAAIRGHLVKLAADLHAFVLTAHHIICDGWSVNVIVSEFAEIYGGLCRGETVELQAPLPFHRYARDQQQRDAAELEKVESYWLDQYKVTVTPLELPTDRPRAAFRTYAGTSRCRRIDASLYQAIKKAGARQGRTLFVTLLAAFEALMARLGEQDEVVVGVPTAGQSLLEDQILVGHCVNFLPIRGRWNASTTVSEHLAAVGKSVLDAYDHQSYTFGTLVRKLALPRQANRLPLTEIQFNLERLADKLELPGLQGEVAPNAKAFVNFDIFLNVIESNEGLRLDCDYNTDLYDEATIDRWLDGYQALLEAFVADASQPLVRTPYLTVAARQEVLQAHNSTSVEYPKTACVHQLIERQAATTPDAVAAVFGKVSLSYAALDKRVNQLANHLLTCTGGSGRLVGVAVERSLDMLVSLLAVLKAGCAYVPLDPNNPPTRLRHILGEAKVAALIADGAENAALAAAGTPVIDLVRDSVKIAGTPMTSPTCKVGADDLAYVIFTSGSTGLPKGVEISHRSVVNLLTSMARQPGLGAKDVLLAVTTVSFDIAALELFLPLIVGARVVIAERDETMDGSRLLKRLGDVGASVMQATPATWRLLLEASFRAQAGFRMLCGGEALPRDLANRLLEGNGELWNVYGPTETTIWSSCVRVQPGDGPISVGYPIANTQFYVLDRFDQPVPVGVTGQLHIGGDGVACGYHHRPELTTEKFVANPFAPGRMYRTGDLARRLANGEIQILGRMDHQIKLRGFRIELGEIESVLSKRAGLVAVSVILREDVPGMQRLVAYYVERPERPAQTPAALWNLLEDELPAYMIPTAWVKLDALPLTPNGKLDRARLPAPDDSATTERAYVAPKTPTEEALARIWAEVLHRDRISTADDLLHLGADSIQVFQIAARANRDGINLTAKQLMQSRTIAAVAEQCSATGPQASKDQDLPSLSQFKRKPRSQVT